MLAKRSTMCCFGTKFVIDTCGNSARFGQVYATPHLISEVYLTDTWCMHRHKNSQFVFSRLDHYYSCTCVNEQIEPVLANLKTNLNLRRLARELTESLISQYCVIATLNKVNLQDLPSR